MSTDFVKVEILEAIAIVTIDKEASYNALNNQVLSELKTTFKSLTKDSNVKGCILTGAGEKAFIAGADIKEMAAMDEKEAQNFSELGQQVTNLIENAPFPVIAAVNGFALGGGLEMAMACDYIYATSNAIFGLPEVSLGLIPGFGGTQRLARICGRNIAKEMIYSGKKIDANRAKELGLILAIYSNKNELMENCKNNLKECFKNSPLAIKLAKSVLNQGIETDLVKGLSIEAQTFAGLFNSQDMKEGTQAFIDKRKPQFKGE